jgi:hypothetical protein
MGASPGGKTTECLMRKFYNPGAILSSFVGGGKASPPAIMAPAADAGADDAAREEASRKARTAAAARSGRSDTLLTPLGGVGVSSLDTAKRTLLGGAA